MQPKLLAVKLSLRQEATQSLQRVAEPNQLEAALNNKAADFPRLTSVDSGRRLLRSSRVSSANSATSRLVTRETSGKTLGLSTTVFLLES